MVAPSLSTKSMDSSIEHSDVVLIGAGIMSAHLATLLHLLEPSWTIQVIERADGSATESSNPWNNAGTGHAALCELNYTPQTADGSVDISRAITVNEKFQLSRQWWSYAVRNNILSQPKDFINPVPHVNFVQGVDNIYYLKKRYETMRQCDLFSGMTFSQDESELASRFPLMLQGRDFSTPIAMSWNLSGTDLNYGALTKQLFSYLSNTVNVFYGEQVTDLVQEANGKWKVSVHNLRTGTKRKIYAKFVFIGAGGASLRLLQKSGIKEARGIGGFPVSGIFARCTNPEVIAQHSAKVYGKPSVGSPPMSMPHLDTRIINGKRGLLFGPYGGWSPKFLKAGSNIDLFASIRPGNFFPMVSTAFSEFSLLKYLIAELTKDFSSRILDLKQFYPEVNSADWKMITAGQRVQIIRPAGLKGVLEFGTAVVASADGSISALLGASPGASIVVSAMIEVLQKCFPERYTQWLPKLQEMIPSLGYELARERKLFDEITQETSATLALDQTV